MTGLAPIDMPAKAFFVGSGTEAIEAALLFATNWRRSNEIIALRNSYHGRSFGAIAITGNKGWSASAFSPLNVSYALAPYCYRCAQGLGNGMAIGAVVGRTDMVDSLRANSISTFGGNPLATTYALANLEFIEENDLQSNAGRVGKFLMEGLKPFEDEYDIVGEVRGKGLMLGMELVTDGETKEPNPQAAGRVMEECRERGLLVGKGGLYGNVLRISPPLVID